MRSMLLVSVVLSLAACGSAPETRTLVDESNDNNIITEVSSRHLAGTQSAGPDLVGTQWTWREAHCTEGPLDLAGREFARTTRVNSTSEGLLFVHDDTVGESCRRTVVQHAKAGSEADSQWQMEEQAVVTIGECEDLAEAERPGDVRRRGTDLEVYVQRSVWCGGLELRMVYTSVAPTPIDDLNIALHYAAHFNRRDAQKLTELFAATGSLVDPFTRTPLDQATRYDGQAAVYGWFQEAFTATNWLALRIVGLEAGSTPGSVVLDWHYMDPRLDAPFAGRNRFTVAGGEIFETSIEITAQEVTEPTPAPTQEAVVQPAPVEAPTNIDPEAGDE